VETTKFFPKLICFFHIIKFLVFVKQWVISFILLFIILIWIFIDHQENILENKSTTVSAKIDAKKASNNKSSPTKKESVTATKTKVVASHSKSRDNVTCRSQSPRNRRRQRSPTPRPTRIHVGRLTRNVNKEHLLEIFSVYGTVKSVDLPMYDVRLNPTLNKGYGYIDFETPDAAEDAMKHMDGGQIDGQEISAAPVLVPRVAAPRRPRSPLPLYGMPPRRPAPARAWRSPPRSGVFRAILE
ncbi:hypothetical protein HAZT_HAZT007882, partial [Hyalella azteca]